MEFDFSQVTLPVGGVSSFPDFPYVGQPLPSNQIKDGASLQGGSTTSSASITGTASSQGILGG